MSSLLAILSQMNVVTYFVHSGPSLAWPAVNPADLKLKTPRPNKCSCLFIFLCREGGGGGGGGGGVGAPPAARRRSAWRV